jgi:hypothetical protein
MTRQYVAMGSGGLAPEPSESRGREGHLDADLEVLGDLQGDVQTRGVLAPFQVSDGLTVDAQPWMRDASPLKDSAYVAAMWRNASPARSAWRTSAAASNGTLRR